MANATYKETLLVGSGEIKSVVIVTVDETDVEVGFWTELIDQWGTDGVKALVEAEALWSLGFYQDAHDKLSLVKDGRGIKSWAKQWIEEHPIPVAIPVTDLLG